MLEKTLESPLDCKEIQTVHPKGNQSWIFIGRPDAEAATPILWPPDVKNWHWKRPWCWERSWAGGEVEEGGWDGWIASPTQWTWVWTGSESWWWTGRPGMLSMGLQRVGHDWAIKLKPFWFLNLQPSSPVHWPWELALMLSWNKYTLLSSGVPGVALKFLYSLKAPKGPHPSEFHIPMPKPLYPGYGSAHNCTRQQKGEFRTEKWIYRCIDWLLNLKIPRSRKKNLREKKSQTEVETRV